jgi:hypothetical protein
VSADPELLRQLDAAAAAEKPIEAVVTLKPDSTEPQAVEDCAHRLVERVQKETGVDPHDVNVLGNLGLVMISADAPFVRALLDQPEVESAAANRRGGPAVEPL